VKEMKEFDVETLFLCDFCTAELVWTEQEEIGNSANIKELLRIAVSVE